MGKYTKPARSAISNALTAGLSELRQNAAQVSLATVTGALVGFTLSFLLPPIWTAIGAAGAPVFTPAVGAIFFGGISLFTAAFSPVINAAYDGYQNAKHDLNKEKLHTHDLSTLGFVQHIETEPDQTHHRDKSSQAHLYSVHTEHASHEGVVMDEAPHSKIIH